MEDSQLLSLKYGQSQRWNNDENEKENDHSERERKNRDRERETETERTLRAVHMIVLII